MQGVNTLDTRVIELVLRANSSRDKHTHAKSKQIWNRSVSLEQEMVFPHRTVKLCVDHLSCFLTLRCLPLTCTDIIVHGAECTGRGVGLFVDCSLPHLIDLWCGSLTWLRPAAPSLGGCVSGSLHRVTSSQLYYTRQVRNFYCCQLGPMKSIQAGVCTVAIRCVMLSFL